MDRGGNIKLCDFGISGQLVDSIAKTRDAGCRPYMAVSRKKQIQYPWVPVDAASDVKITTVKHVLLFLNCIVSMRKCVRMCSTLRRVGSQSATNFKRDFSVFL